MTFNVCVLSGAEHLATLNKTDPSQEVYFAEELAPSTIKGVFGRKAGNWSKIIGGPTPWP